MKISERTKNTLPGPGSETRRQSAFDSEPEMAAEARWPVPKRAVAPWWHTGILVAVIVGISTLSGLQSRGQSFAGSHIARYSETIAWEWLLAALAWWGLRMRGVPLRRLLGQRRSGAREWLRDFGAALLFWIVAMIVLAAIAAVLTLLHLIHPQKAVIALAPSGGAEMILWIALCVSAGIAEEVIFRGYLLQQFASLRGKLWIGIIASSLLFGAGHGYEGVGGMIAISAYGAMFCALALERRSLRAGMMAHAWHDTITGIALAVVKHFHAI
jgi:membrane protease YdiL (CAAX protease family)